MSAIDPADGVGNAASDKVGTRISTKSVLTIANTNQLQGCVRSDNEMPAWAVQLQARMNKMELEAMTRRHNDNARAFNGTAREYTDYHILRTEKAGPTYGELATYTDVGGVFPRTSVHVFSKKQFKDFHEFFDLEDWDPDAKYMMKIWCVEAFIHGWPDHHVLCG